MSGWQVGDLALCIKQGQWRERHDRKRPLKSPQPGCRYVVSEVVIGTDGVVFLGLEGFHPFEIFVAKRFVKITPDAELIAEERKAGVPA